MGNQLHLACWRDDIETFKKIIDFAPGCLKSLDVFGVQPLHVAAFKGSLKCLDVILGRQIHGNLDDTFGGGITAFHIAKDANQSFALSLLDNQKEEDHALNIFKIDYCILLSVFKCKQSSIYRECLKYEAKAKKKGILECIPPKGDINAPLVESLTHFTPLFLSVMLNDLKGVKKLLERGAVIKDTALSPKKSPVFSSSLWLLPIDSNPDRCRVLHISHAGSLRTACHCCSIREPPLCEGYNDEERVQPRYRWS